MRIQRVKHTREELKAIKELDRIWHHASNQDAKDLILAATMALKFHYESDRQRELIQNYKVLKSISAS